MNSLLSDIRYALRTFRQKPGFAIAAVLTLALGIGANSALFTLVNSVLLRPLPFPQSDRLYEVSLAGKRQVGSMTDGDYMAYSGQTRAFEGLATFAPQGFTLTGVGDAAHLKGTAVTPNLFDVLGVQAKLGRTFLPGEVSGSAVLSDELWRTRFRADRAILGQFIALDGQPVRVVGVMPPGFAFPDKSDLWTPLWVRIQPGARFSRLVVGRLRAGYSVQQALAELNIVAARAIKDDPRGHRNWTAGITPLADFMVRDVRLSLWIMLGAVGFVLLIACANVATLLLARASQRRKEIALRHSLGASRLRLVRQLVTESLVLSLAGGALGIVLALWGVAALMAAIPGGKVPRVEEIGVDTWVLGFTLLISVVIGIAVGIVPALQLTGWAHSSLQEQRGSKGNQRIRGLLVVGEVAVTVILLIGAGLMLQSFVRLRSLPTGFDPSSVLTASVELPSPAYDSTDREKAFHRELLGRLSTIPGVAAAGLANWFPFGQGFAVMGDFYAEGLPKPNFAVQKPGVSPDYFHAMGIPLLKGRFFNDRDTEKAPSVAIIGESVARRVWPGEDPIGKRVTLEDRPKPSDWLTVVGVVADVKLYNMTDAAPPAVYQPFPQVTRQGFLSDMTYVIRSSGDPVRLGSAIREQLKAVDPDLPVLRIATMSKLVAASTSEPRFQAEIIGSFAILALLLAVIGIYGVMSYFVTERTREIGIRMAVGAKAGHVLTMVVRRGLLLVAAGVVCGAAGAWGVTRVLATLLFELKPTDPPTFAAAALLLVMVATAATFIPARRATQVDPSVALRYE